MKLTEAKIKEAQEVIEAVIAELGLHAILIYESGRYDNSVIIETDIFADSTKAGNDLLELYINRQQELFGTTPPPF